jgi:hypothetical protein
VLTDELQYVGTHEVDVEPFARHAFNLRTSNKLPSDRALPDTRHIRYKLYIQAGPGWQLPSIDNKRYFPTFPCVVALIGY